jgi:hypothetical protein
MGGIEKLACVGTIFTTTSMILEHVDKEED